MYGHLFGWVTVIAGSAIQWTCEPIWFSIVNTHFVQHALLVQIWSGLRILFHMHCVPFYPRTGRHAVSTVLPVYMHRVSVA